MAKYARNPGFDGLRAGINRALGRGRKTRRRTRSKARRMPGRNALGHFVKRKRATVKRAPVRKRRAAPRYRRAARGRFASRYSPKYVRRQRARPTRSRKHYRARVTIRPRQRIAGLVVRNPRTGELMPMATVVNPRRRRRHRKVRAASPRRRRRSRARRTTSNPRRHRRGVRRRTSHKRHRRTVRNPAGGLKGAFMTSLPVAAGGVAGGIIAGFLDTKVLTGRPTLAILAKLGIGVGSLLLLRRRAPNLALGLAGGALGSVGYSVGVKMGGGMVAHNAAGAIKGLGDMAGEDPALNNLLSGSGFGVLLEGLGDGSVQAYLSGMSGEGDDAGSGSGIGVLLQALG